VLVLAVEDPQSQVDFQFASCLTQF